MAIADGSRTRLALVAESVLGTTPTDPAFISAGYTDHTLNITRQYVRSNNKRPDRNVSSAVPVSGGAGGDINGELMHDAFTHALMESALFSTFSSDVMVNGVTQQSFTLESTYETGATDQYLRYVGQVVNSLEIQCAIDQIINVRFGMVGLNGSTDTAEITNATYAAVDTSEVLNSVAGFGNLTIGGVTGADLIDLTLNIDNGVDPRRALGSFGAISLRNGRCTVSGSMSVYFEDAALLGLFLNGTNTGLTFTLGQNTGEKYTFNIPQIKVTNLNLGDPGNDQDVVQQINFEAEFDSGIGGAIQITRNVT
ncbi:MAG: phage tail tube protein [Pseudomonadota bacterium]